MWGFVLVGRGGEWREGREDEEGGGSGVEWWERGKGRGEGRGGREGGWFMY